MKKTIVWIFGTFALLLAAALVLSVYVSRPVFDETLDPTTLDTIEIAAPEEALTFARVGVETQRRVLLVTQYRDGKMIGVDLNQRLKTAEDNPLALFRQFGYAALRDTTTSVADTVAVSVTALDVPFDAREQNIGVGLSYAEHARESSLEQPPFLFPKFALPTRATSTLAKQNSARLDYEAELGFVALEDLSGPAPMPPTMGLVLCNEATDRWALVRNFERNQPMGTTGFADGKSRAGFAPIGPLLVIPRNLEMFYRDIELRLYLNGRLRQKERTMAMRWGPGDILREVFRRPDGYRYGASNVSLLAAGAVIPSGTILFSGTPAGVLFRPHNVWNPWHYLRPGDEVVIRSDMLGVIRNRIVE